MSQVIDIKDDLAERRDETRQQEQCIQVEQLHTRWHRPVPARVVALEKGLLVALVLVVLPLLALALIIAVVFFLFVCCSRLVGTLLRRAR